MSGNLVCPWKAPIFLTCKVSFWKVWREYWSSKLLYFSHIYWINLLIEITAEAVMNFWPEVVCTSISESFGSFTHHDHVLQECRWCAQPSDVTEQLHWNDTSFVLPSSPLLFLICRRSRERGLPTKVSLSCVLFSGAKSPKHSAFNHRLLHCLWN